MPTVETVRIVHGNQSMRVNQSDLADWVKKGWSEPKPEPKKEPKPDEKGDGKEKPKT